MKYKNKYYLQTLFTKNHNSMEMSPNHEAVNTIVKEIAKKHEIESKSTELSNEQESKFIKFTLKFKTNDIYHFTLTHSPNKKEDFTNINIIHPELIQTNTTLTHVRALISHLNMFLADLENNLSKIDIAFRLVP